MASKKYETPEAFKQALEQHLRKAVSGKGEALAKRRQLVVFDRLLARIVHQFKDHAMLKGGLVVELRLHRARTTKDVDLRMTGSATGLLERLQKAGRIDLGDFMAFEVTENRDNPEIVQEGMVYDGKRFRVECRLAGKIYGSLFGLDIGFGDPIVSDPDEMKGDDLLKFAGIQPPMLRLYPIETHIAEKLHAYTMPRRNPNSRVKDLPDLALLASVGSLDSAQLRKALKLTFEFRKVQPLPDKLPAPPEFWGPVYARMAKEDDLPWKTLADVFEAAKDFLDPILAGKKVGAWSSKTWSWR